MPLIEFTDRGLYCRAGDFYIDPWKPVPRAVITHAHSDHARSGSGKYLCHHASAAILRLRLGVIDVESVEWKESIIWNGVNLSLFPAGHIIGSSQVRIEYKGEVWVVSGDYKVEDDGISGAFEPVKCHTFITESTFGLPIYKWKAQADIYTSVQEWLGKSWANNKTPVLIAYSLGKAQRVLTAVSKVTDNIFVHGAIWNVQQCLQNAGWRFPPVKLIDKSFDRREHTNAVVIAPPSADGTPWMKHFFPYSTGVCSGWMQVRGNARRRNADAGFALSDHADWDGLLSAVRSTGAERVYVTHGFQSVFSRYLNENGMEAFEVKTQFGEEDEGDKIEDAANDLSTGETMAL